jgi:hypothetical protein
MEKDARHYKKYLRELTLATEQYIDQLDEVMKGPSTPERGKKIAHLTNALNMAKDQAKHFGLGLSLKGKMG